MYARLWWKDTRQFWPIWVILVLAAVAAQWLILGFMDTPAHYGLLGGVALLWAALYAFAAGAAAFAGERESGTLRLLDIMPVDRRVVWRSKVSFALVTTLALTLVLQFMAILGAEQWHEFSVHSIWPIVGLGATVLLALGWSLFWSSNLQSALGAAVVAMVCTGVSCMYLVDNSTYQSDGLPPIRTLWEFLLILATGAASHLLFTRNVRTKRVRLEFRSPVVVTRFSPGGVRHTHLQSPVAIVPALEPPPRSRPTVETQETSTLAPVRSRSWIIEVRNLTWKTIKEGRKSWCLLVAIVLVLIVMNFLKDGYLDAVWIVLLSTGITFAAGVNAFGLENRAQTQRFLAHHGARAGLVWLIKFVVWGIGLLMILGLLAVIAIVTRARGVVQGEWILGPIVLALLFTVALLSGMAIRRTITAFVIAIVVGAGVVAPLLMLVTAWMLPALGILFVPMALLAVSWAWSGDWMLDRPALSRWLRLGLLLCAAFGLLASGYVGFRIASIRDVGPITPPAAWIDARSNLTPADNDAAELYRKAGDRLTNRMDSKAFVNENREALQLIRQAAARPECQFDQPEKQTLIDRDRLAVPPYGQFSRLVALDARDRQQRGDLAGAWDDLVMMFRMARHFSVGADPYQTLGVLNTLERNALGLAMDWALSIGQTPERLESALAAYRDLPKISPLTDAIRAQANLTERTLDRPASEFREWLMATTFGNGPAHSNKLLPYLYLDAQTTPWERARARRVNWLIASKLIETAMQEPAQRSTPMTQHSGMDDPEIEYALRTTPQAMKSLFYSSGLIEANDRNEIGRRALLQVLAIRAWQYRHDGRLPERLEALAPDELLSLPKDPYSGRLFAYIPSTDEFRQLPHRFMLDGMGAWRDGFSITVEPNSWLLISFGRDSDRPRDFQFVFPIPPIDPKNIPGRIQDRLPANSKDQSKPATPPAQPKP